MFYHSGLQKSVTSIMLGQILKELMYIIMPYIAIEYLQAYAAFEDMSKTGSFYQYVGVKHISFKTQYSS